MALFFGNNMSLNESGYTTNGQITPSDLFNASLLYETASIGDLAIAIYEANDFMEEATDILKNKDVAYELTVNESTDIRERSLQKLNEGFGDYVNKAVEWAKKMLNSIVAFFKNTWLKLTNKWAYRQQLIKDKNTIAAISLAKNDPDKWDNVSLDTMPNLTDANITAIVTKIDSITNSSSSDDISTLKDDVNEMIKDLTEKESQSGEDAIKAFDAGYAIYKDGKLKAMDSALKKMEASVGKMIDQFIKNIKAKGTTAANSSIGKLKSQNTTNFGSKINIASHGTGTNKYANGKNAFDDANKDSSSKDMDTARLEYEKKVIPLYAMAIHKVAAAIRANADLSWKAVITGVRIGGGEYKKLLNY